MLMVITETWKKPIAIKMPNGMPTTKEILAAGVAPIFAPKVVIKTHNGICVNAPVFKPTRKPLSPNAKTFQPASVVASANSATTGTITPSIPVESIPAENRILAGWMLLDGVIEYLEKTMGIKPAAEASDDRV